MSETILYADGLYHVYESKAEDGNVVALRGLHIDMKAGEAIAVVGPSGSGKSTLDEVPWWIDETKCWFCKFGWKEYDTSYWARTRTSATKDCIFHIQEGNLLPDLNARDNVAQPLRHQGVSSKKALKYADEMLEKLGMGHQE